MRKTMCALLLMASASLYAKGAETGVFTLYKTLGYQPDGFCDVGTHLVLDKAEVMGSVAFLTDFVDGRCRLYVNPNHRHYVLSAGEADACNVITYRGRRMSTDGAYELSITDRRKSTCVSPSDTLDIVISEKDPAGKMRKRYSYQAP